MVTYIFIIIFHVVPESLVQAQAVSTCVLDPTAALTPPDRTPSATNTIHECKKHALVFVLDVVRTRRKQYCLKASTLMLSLSFTIDIQR
jgi:hypothetical protein